MTVSIVHRITGTGMATVGTLLLVWWLAAIAAGPAAYGVFLDVFTTSTGALNVVGWVVGVALTWSVFQHMMSGIRHLVLDTGAAFELKLNRRLAVLTFVASAVLTVAFWLFVGMK
ncbi:succinate dehydrogenase / fumarate reductase cytochrome b subunit [Sphingomonas sp. BE138]|nr:succinate dehydrogenase / fumarate reductase cytochrome b subunit [Sphingomonas sp. BE138]